MNTVPHGWCQCVRGGWAHGAMRRGWRLIFVGLLALARTACADGPSAAPEPPAWQRDLDAARVLQAAVTLAPAANPADEAARREHLAQLYGHLAAQYPDQAAVQKAAGDYYSGVDQNDLALTCWQRAATLDPQDGSTAEALGTAYLARGRVRDAEAQFERAVAAHPDVALYHFDLGNVLYLFRRELLAPPGRPTEQAALTEALGHFRHAAELAPADLRLAQAYAETFYVFAQPDWEQALTAWKAVLALSGENTDFANGHLARVSLRLGRSADVDTYLDRIHSPAFDAMKASFRKKAATMNPTGAPAAPATTPGTAQ